MISSRNLLYVHSTATARLTRPVTEQSTRNRTLPGIVAHYRDLVSISKLTSETFICYPQKRALDSLMMLKT